MSRISKVTPIGKASKNSDAKDSAGRRRSVTTKKQRRSLAIQSAIATPTLAALMTSGAVSLVRQESWWGLAPALVALSVLCVSLPHVRDGFAHVTGQSLRNATLMAVGIDAGLVYSESMLHAAVFEAVPWAWVLPSTGMALCLYLSVRYNVVAYTLHLD